MGSNLIDEFFDPSWLPKRDVFVVTPDGRDQHRWINQLYHEPAEPRWVPVDWPIAATGPTNITQPVFEIQSLLDAHHRQTFASCYTVPEWVLDESDPKRKNKIARKNRDGVRASQNATGRKWWEHR